MNDHDHHTGFRERRLVPVGERLSRQIVDLVIASSNLVRHPYGAVEESGLSRLTVDQEHAGSNPVSPVYL